MLLLLKLHYIELYCAEYYLFCLCRKSSRANNRSLLSFLHLLSPRSNRITMATSLWQTGVLLLTILYRNIEGKRVSCLDAILRSFPSRPEHESWTEGVRLLLRRVAIMLLCFSCVADSEDIQHTIAHVEALSKQVNTIIANNNSNNNTITKDNLAQLLPVPKIAEMKACRFFQYLCHYGDEVPSRHKKPVKRTGSPTPRQRRNKKSKSEK